MQKNTASANFFFHIFCWTIGLSDKTVLKILRVILIRLKFWKIMHCSNKKNGFEQLYNLKLYFCGWNLENISSMGNTG